MMISKGRRGMISRYDELDWGPTTVEFYDEANKDALHVFNVHLIGPESKARVLKFVCARVRHVTRHLPVDTSQRITIDIRGQAPNDQAIELLRTSILEELARHGIAVTINFLR